MGTWEPVVPKNRPHSAPRKQIKQAYMYHAHASCDTKIEPQRVLHPSLPGSKKQEIGNLLTLMNDVARPALPGLTVLGISQVRRETHPLTHSLTHLTQSSKGVKNRNQPPFILVLHPCRLVGRFCSPPLNFTGPGTTPPPPNLPYRAIPARRAPTFPVKPSTQFPAVPHSRSRSPTYLVTPTASGIRANSSPTAPPEEYRFVDLTLTRRHRCTAGCT